MLKTDLLERHHGVRQPRLALVDRGVGSLKYVKFLMSFSEFDGFENTFQSGLSSRIKFS